MGVLIISEKLSEASYTADDFEFLLIITVNLSIAIENAFLYDELARRERIKKELENAKQIQTASLLRKCLPFQNSTFLGFRFLNMKLMINSLIFEE